MKNKDTFAISHNNNINIKQTVFDVQDALIDKKAENPVILDISGISVVADYFLIVTGNNINHVKTLMETAEEKLGKMGVFPKHIEGRQSGGWVLLDYSDFIIHVFGKEEREFYNIEHIWGDATVVNSLSEQVNYTGV